MVQIDIIERENKVIIVDDDNSETYYMEKNEDSVLETEDEISENIIEYVEENSDFTFNSEDIDFPINVSTNHHLEDVVGHQVEYEYGRFLEDIIEDGRLNLPSIEIHENWKIDEQGNVELVSVEYNGEKYTKHD